MFSKNDCVGWILITNIKALDVSTPAQKLGFEQSGRQAGRNAWEKY